jgi:hypothetical protein
MIRTFRERGQRDGGLPAGMRTAVAESLVFEPGGVGAGLILPDVAAPGEQPRGVEGGNRYLRIWDYNDRCNAPRGGPTQPERDRPAAAAPGPSPPRQPVCASSLMNVVFVQNRDYFSYLSLPLRDSGPIP